MEEMFSRFDDLRRFIVKLYSNKNVRRWTIEILVAIIVGLLAGCFSYNALHKRDTKLTVSTENASAVQEETKDTESTAQETSEDTEEIADGIITVIDPSDYVESIQDWSSEEISAAISERSDYLTDNKYWPTVVSYWETERGVTGDACYCTYLFNTDTTVYTTSDFDNVPAEVIHIAKNEIYARHGYSFRDSEIMNYFMGQIWYSPSVMPVDFSEDVFTETEVKNLDMLNSIDTM